MRLSFMSSLQWTPNNLPSNSRSNSEGKCRKDIHIREQRRAPIFRAQDEEDTAQHISQNVQLSIAQFAYTVFPLLFLQDELLRS